MAATSKSTKLKLNLWQETDKPERADFVSDNQIIEEKLGAHLTDSTKHLTSSEKLRASQPFQVFNFIGSGSAQRTYALNFSARAVFLFAADRNFTETTDDGKTVYAAVQIGGYHTPGISLSGKTLTTYQQTDPATATTLALNQTNQRYVGIAFQ